MTYYNDFKKESKSIEICIIFSNIASDLWKMSEND